jgi:cephalosporin hydroxylase
LDKPDTLPYLVKNNWPNLIPKRLRHPISQAIIGAFARLYDGRRQQTWKNTRWLGISILKNPSDLWVYQEMVHELRPDLIIETGTFAGGSAHYLATLCDLVDHGRVLTIDIESRDRPDHDRVNYITGSSVDPRIVGPIAEQAHASEVVMVILDSDHSKTHVIDELRLYAPLVTVGSYVIVEDTTFNGHPIYRNHGPGPMEAVDEFITEDSRFTIDRTREKFMHTFNPRGYLRRTS